MAKAKKEDFSNDLIQAFIDAISNFYTSENAKTAIAYEERKLVETIQSLGGQNTYTTSRDVPAHMVEQLVKNSIQVHIGRAQSEQVENEVKRQIQDLQKHINHKYVGKKFTFLKNDKTSDAIEGIYFDSKSGGYRFSKYTSKQIKGKIRELSLIDNLIIVEPSYVAKKLTPNRLLFRVHVLDLNDLSPQIKII